MFMRTCACVHVRNSSRMINIVHAYVCLCSCQELVKDDKYCSCVRVLVFMLGTRQG